jgi:pimeloyl-ACP methyl ester carboxylesterase
MTAARASRVLIAFTLLSCSTWAADPAAPNTWPEILQKTARVVRVFDGPDGVPRWEQIDAPVWSKMKAEHVQITSLPANAPLGRHRPAKRHLIIPVRGVTTMILSDTVSIQSRPGQILLIEDTQGIGHAGQIGADGYEGIDVTLADEREADGVGSGAEPARLRHFIATSSDGVALAASASAGSGGVPLLFIHGFGQSRWVFNRLLTSALCQRHRCVSFDLRGHGDSGKPATPASYASAKIWADDVAAVIRAAAIEKPLIVAWSYGTAVAMDYLRVAGPAAMPGLVLVDGTGGVVAQQPVHEAAADAARARMIEDGRSADAALRLNAYERSARLLTVTELPLSWYQTAAAVSLQAPVYAREAILARRIDNADLLAKLPAHTLFIVGEKDRSMGPETLKNISRSAPAAQMLVYPGAGHTPFAESPLKFQQDLAALADSLGR